MVPNADPSAHKRVWWKEAVFYQVYPASFKDSNGDGWGDIPGLISKIDYIASLGVDAVWLSPMFESPQIDMGYDISNYEGVYRPYGTLEDVDTLTKACHDRGLKLILDLVVNHTSDQHAWFRESRSSKDNPKRDWYFWKPPRYDEHGERMPPTNYRGYFAGSTWTWDEGTQEYYLHLYTPEQPDLNWENEDCRKAIYYSAMRFWLDRGIDGFRVDTVNKYSKHTDFPDAPIIDPTSTLQFAPQFWCNGPRIHEFIQEMNTQVLAHYRTFDNQPVVTVGELALTPEPRDVLRYVSASEKELDMVFQFDITRLGQGLGGPGGDKYYHTPWVLPQMKAIVEKWQTFIEGTDGWTTVFDENHDHGRSIDRYGDASPQWREACAKMLALWLITQTGTLFLYQGQEIGMINAPAEWNFEEYKDVDGQNYWKETLASGDPVRKERVKKGLHLMARDHARLPMQWDSSANAGFTSGQPWMRTHDLYQEINVEKQVDDAESVLAFYKRFLRLRKEYKDLFVCGSFELLDLENERTFAFRKQSKDQTAFVALNFTSSEQPVPEGGKEDMKLLVSTCRETAPDVLQPWEGRVYINHGG